jgi:hypothetical protein
MTLLQESMCGADAPLLCGMMLQSYNITRKMHTTLRTLAHLGLKLLLWLPPALTPLFLSDTRCRQLCMQQVLQPRPCLTVVLVVATTSPSVNVPSMTSNCLPLQRQSQW